MACFGHVAVGLMAGRIQHQGRTIPERPSSEAATLIGFGVLGTLPDFDVFAVMLGASEHTTAGHRGASHSLLMALALAVAGGLLARRYGWNGVRTALALALAVGSHSVLDTLAQGGRAIPLFWPLTSHRFAAPLRLFPDAPRGVAFISRHGLTVAALEFAYFLPVTAFALWPRARKRRPNLQLLDGGAERPLVLPRAPRAETAEIPAADNPDAEPTIPPSMRSTG
jgi:inner membrane protein